MHKKLKQMRRKNKREMKWNWTGKLCVNKTMPEENRYQIFEYSSNLHRWYIKHHRRKMLGEKREQRKGTGQNKRIEFVLVLKMMVNVGLPNGNWNDYFDTNTKPSNAWHWHWHWHPISKLTHSFTHTHIKLSIAQHIPSKANVDEKWMCIEIMLPFTKNKTKIPTIFSPSKYIFKVDSPMNYRTNEKKHTE